jgi:alkanesulfonate monooxygenase SsuD/methylene tetrahydromethanopterin reductase-like flavin-dependent oxidoreductase (luciferase family)
MGELDRAAAALPREAVERTVLAGSPERVAAQVASLLQPGITRLTIRPHAASGGTVAGVLRAFAHTVMPRVVELRSAGAVPTTSDTGGRTC